MISRHCSCVSMTTLLGAALGCSRAPALWPAGSSGNPGLILTHLTLGRLARSQFHDPFLVGRSLNSHTRTGNMCDYSLEAFRSRPAREGEQYVTSRFTSGSVGFIAPGDTTTAICMAYDIRLTLENIPQAIQS